MTDLSERPVLGDDVPLIVSTEEKADAMARADIRYAQNDVPAGSQAAVSLLKDSERIDAKMLEHFRENDDFDAFRVEWQRVAFDITTTAVNCMRCPEIRSSVWLQIHRRNVVSDLLE